MAPSCPTPSGPTGFCCRGPNAYAIFMAGEVDLQAEIDAAIKKGQFPDRASAIAGLQKQLIDYQKGALKDQLKGVSPVDAPEKASQEIWKEFLGKAGGDEDKAVHMYAEELKKVVAIPVITVGRITDPLQAETILASGKADLVAMGRASLADPHLPNKAAAGKFDEIRPCIGCLQGCIGMISQNQPATCLVNPTLGKEGEMRILPAQAKKKVFVAGAGPAGMEAALVAAARGHEVQVFERRDRTGGQLYTASIPPTKGEIAGFVVWQKKQFEDRKGRVHLNTELTESIIKDGNPDLVIVATGSRPISPDLPGMKGENVATAQAVLEGKAIVGKRVAVLGGGMIGAETANHLAQHGKEVTIIEMLPEIATDVNVRIRYFLLKDLAENRVRIFANSTVKEVSGDALIIERGGQKEKIGPFDSIVLALGLSPANELQARLEGKVKVITVGDAVNPRKALEAIREGYLAGLEI